MRLEQFVYKLVGGYGFRVCLEVENYPMSHRRLRRRFYIAQRYIRTPRPESFYPGSVEYRLGCPR